MPHCARALFAAVLILTVVACSDDAPPPRYRDGAGASGTSNGGFGNAAANGGTSGSAGFGNASGSGGGITTAGSGGTASIGDGCAAISETATNQLQPADIIFAIDNSGSMDEEIVFVREQMNRFSQLIIDSGIDVRIILISSAIGMQVPDNDLDFDEDDQDNGLCIDAPLGSGACPDDSLAPHYVHIAEEVSSNDALNLFIDTYPSWRDQLRPNATKTFVVVTDDNAEDAPNDTAAAFTASVAGLDAMLFAKWSFSGIYCFSDCPEAAEIGAVYAELVAQTGGVGGDLCLQDFAPVFDELAKSVIGASSIDCEWAIPEAPQGQTFEIGRVNVQYTASGAGAPQTIFHVPSLNECAAQGGWFYNDNANPTRLVVCPSSCNLFKDDANARLDVLFGCETQNGPD